jgi:hypothetical protein
MPTTRPAPIGAPAGRPPAPRGRPPMRSGLHCCTSIFRFDSGRSILHLPANVVASRSLPPLCRTLPAEPGGPAANWSRLDSRDQARRFSHVGTARCCSRAAVHPERPRLDRFPLIVEAVSALKGASCLIDGEAIASRYRSGRSRDWVKPKNAAPANFQSS